MAMLLFWSEGTPEKRQRIVDFVREYKEIGIAAFINILENDRADERILEIGEKAKTEDAKKVFSKIEELAEWIRKVSDQLAEAFFDTEKIREHPTEIGDVQQAKEIALKSIDNVLSKVSEIVEKFYEVAVSKKTISEENVDRFLNDLENSRIQIDILSSLLKVAKENGIKLSPENIREMKVESFEIGELSEDKKKEFLEKYSERIMAMMEKSYAKTFQENPDAFQKVKNNFKERLENIEQFKVYMLTFQGELVAFMTMRPDENEPEAVWAESFIVDAEAQKYSLGIAFAKKAMGEESKKHTILGKVRANNVAIIKTHEDWGFIFDKAHPFQEYGVMYYNMRKVRK